MIQIVRRSLILALLLSLVFTVVLAQETENVESKYNEILNIDPYAFDITELAEFDQIDIKNQAFISVLEKDYNTAIRFYLYLAKHNVDDASIYYELAKCYAFLGKEQYAANFLIMAINYGFNNFTLISKEKAFQLLLRSPSFSETYKAVLDTGKGLGSNIYVKAEKLVKCRVLFPENYNPEKSYPLLIGMHGYGGSTEDFAGVWSKLDTHAFIFVIPEAPYLKSPDDFNMGTGYSWGIDVNDLDLYKRSDHLSSEFILNIKKYVSENYKIDKSYILGFSQGGAYAYVTGFKNSSEFDGIICFGARIPDTQKYPWFLSEEDIEKAYTLKVFIAHGKKERQSYKSALEYKRMLKKYGYNVECYIFDDGHVIDQEAFIKAIEWMGLQ